MRRFADALCQPLWIDGATFDDKLLETGQGLRSAIRGREY